jgi:hypothetical protein
MTIVKGSSDGGLKIIEAAYANFNAALDYAGALSAAKTISDVIGVTTTRAQNQLEVADHRAYGACAEGGDRRPRAGEGRPHKDVQQCGIASIKSAAELRALAAWYWAYAELAGNPSIWLVRLSTAEELERQASATEGAEAPLGG